MHEYMNKKCEKCNKFSHCNNNDLICKSKYGTLKQALNMIEAIAKEKYLDSYTDLVIKLNNILSIINKTKDM